MRRLLCLWLLSTALGAQGVSIIRPRPAGPGPSLAALRQELAQERGALLLVLDPQVSQTEEALRALLAEEALLPLDLRTLVADPGQPIALELRSAPICPPGSPRWCLLGPEPGVLAEGPGLPTVAELSKAFAASGCRTRLGVLKGFLEVHGEQLNAVVAVLRELKRLGDSRTRSSLGNAQRPPAADGPHLQVGAMRLSGGAEAAYVENHAPLGEAEDEAIWSDYADLLSQRLPDLLPLSARLSCGLAELIPDCIWASARLQSCAAKRLPEVEAALAARPSDQGLWELWLALRAGGEGAPLTDLLAALTPSPMTPSAAWPPPGLRSAYLRDCRAHQDWPALVELAEPAWRELRDAAKADHRTFAREGVLAAGAWGELCDPLLEALVRLNRFTEADTLLKDWLRLSPWRGAATRAQAIALDCGEEPLVVRWSQLLEHD